MMGEDSNTKSKAFFIKSFLQFFDESTERYGHEFMEKAASILYKDARCGLFHDGMIRPRVLFSKDETGPISVSFRQTGLIFDAGFEPNAIVINASELIKAIEAHFNLYIEKIRDPNNSCLRDCFRKQFEIKSEINSDPIQLGSHFEP